MSSGWGREEEERHGITDRVEPVALLIIWRRKGEKSRVGVKGKMARETVRAGDSAFAHYPSLSQSFSYYTADGENIYPGSHRTLKALHISSRKKKSFHHPNARSTVRLGKIMHVITVL